MADKNSSYDGARSTQGSSEDQARGSGSSGQRRRRHSGPSRKTDGQAVQSGQGNVDKEVQVSAAASSEAGAPPRRSRPTRRGYRPPAAREAEPVVTDEP